MEYLWIEAEDLNTVGVRVKVRARINLIITNRALTPRVKPWVMQSFLTFDSMDTTLSMTIHWKAVELYCTGGLIYVFDIFFFMLFMCIV